MNYRFTLKSANAKTGPIPVTTSARATCAPSCPWKNNGCYAESGPPAIVWNEVDKGERGAGSWAELLQKIKALPAGQIWRHNQAGDLPHASGVIDAAAMRGLARANKGKRGFTYTHHAPTALNLKTIRAAVEAGFTINLSADSLTDADAKAEFGLPVTVVMPSDARQNTVTPAGRKVIVCPATQQDDITCASCKLCAIPDRAAIIGFPAHGARKGRIDASLEGTA